MKATPYLYFRGPADGPHHICLRYSYKCAIAILRQEGQRAQEQVLAASTTRFVILLRPGATNGVLLSDSSSTHRNELPISHWHMLEPSVRSQIKTRPIEAGADVSVSFPRPDKAPKLFGAAPCICDSRLLYTQFCYRKCPGSAEWWGRVSEADTLTVTKRPPHRV